MLDDLLDAAHAMLDDLLDAAHDAGWRVTWNPLIRKSSSRGGLT
jgi:hypothetical protein